MDNAKINTASYTKGMVKDIPIEMLQEGQYLHAINAVNNSDKGDFLKIGNEPSNFQCVDIPYSFNGKIQLINHRFLIFSTNDIDSEIGLFDETRCTYKTLINDSKQLKKLGLKLSNPVFGVSKETWDCSETAYWNDGINPARALIIDKIPYVVKFKKDPTGGCDIETPTDEVDVEKLRLTPLLKMPEISIEKGDQSGTLENGSYRVVIAYSEGEIKTTDFLKISNPLFLYSQTIPNGAIKVTITNIDNTFSNYQLFLLSTINQQTTARLIGTYSQEQRVVYVDSLQGTDSIIDLKTIPVQSIYYEGGDGMFKARDYLMQTGPRTRPLFNYQPQANKIRAKWVAYSVKEDYYRKSGEKIGYTKGELLLPFIRFVYNTGHRTLSFPLINREATTDEKQRVNNIDSASYSSENVEKWEIYDTSAITQTFPAINAEEYPVMEGEFGYYESTETYPDNKEIWGKNACRNIRLFRFPDNCVVPNFENGRINILGFKLENITYPLDENGKPVEGIVGYEILRADKEGNKTIIAKGVLYNTGEYELPVTYSGSTKALYPNFPFNDLRPNKYLSKKLPKGGCASRDYEPLNLFNRQIFTFHSPETHFGNPVLSDYLKIEAEYRGIANGYFEPTYNHPKHKLIRDFSLLLAGAVGIGEGLLAIKGKTTKEFTTPSAGNKGEVVTAGAAAQAAGAPVATIWQKAYDAIRKATKNIPVLSTLGDTTTDIFEITGTAVGATPGGEGGKYIYSTEDTAFKNIPTFVKIGTNVVLFSYFFAQGTELSLEIIKKLVPFRQHGYQCNMEGLYTQQICPSRENMIRKIDNYSYLYPNQQDFEGYRINNWQRESSIVLKLNRNLADPLQQDTSRTTIGDQRIWDNPTTRFSADISCHYVSIRRKDKNIFGQLDDVKIVPTDSTTFSLSILEPSTSPIIFGGDTIIEEFSLKRKTKMFTTNAADTLIGVPDGFSFDYRLYPNIAYPAYWMDTNPYDLTQLFNISNIRLPNDSFHLDRNPNDCVRKIGFSVNNGYVYTSVNGVARFYVESSYNLPFRKNNSVDPEEQHFDKQYSNDLSKLFRNDVLEFDNNYEIDRSLSPIKQLNLTYSQMYPRDFSVIQNRCFTYEPNKLLYSLPSNIEQKADNWRTFLTNNYYIFSKSDGKISTIREFSRTGVLYFFTQAPVKIHSGIDELQTANGVKVILGDGGLFARPPQSLTNTDFDYTECQSSNGVVSTPYGIFFISQTQGKIFNITDTPVDISSPLKWHLAEYLPSKLVKDFPDFALIDNPTIGIGCTAAYDNTNEIVYFCKVDYQIRNEFKNRITYLKDNIFLLDKRTKVLLQNPTYFKSASWTLSYDPKMKSYISFHDWHPEGIIQSDTHFMTVKDQSIWKHNETQSDFCRFYGVQRPWSVDSPMSNIQNVTTTESLEWYLECYNKIGEDRFHILKENFDRAIIYNTEQCSGLLKLNMRNSQRPDLILNYPQYTSSGVEVEVTKTEQKYRLNQFRDLTRNRAEFSSNQNTLFLTEPNGYQSVVNPSAINYAKDQTQRKKFRHIKNVVRFIKLKSESKMILTLTNFKNINSFR